MRDYLVISVPNSLLPQVTGELLALTKDHNDVEVVHADNGRVIHARTWLAELWYSKVLTAQTTPAPEPEPVTSPEPVQEPVPVPEPIAEPEPVASPEPVAAPEPAPRPVVAVVPEPAPQPKPVPSKIRPSNTSASASS